GTGRASAAGAGAARGSSPRRSARRRTANGPGAPAPLRPVPPSAPALRHDQPVIVLVGPFALDALELGVDPAARDQLVVTADLGDGAVRQHDDAVAVPGGGDPVGDQDGGLAGAQPVELAEDEI